MGVKCVKFASGAEFKTSQTRNDNNMRKHLKKNLAKFVLILVIAYILFHAKWNSASFSTTVSENPHQVWEFVSDLNNAKQLNPSIYDFDIIHDKGNYDHWEYGAIIYETMSYIPLLTNVNYADFTLKTSPNKDHYKIISTYKTCFFKFACLNSKSEMTFSSDSSQGGTKFRETIDYQCPYAFSWLCSKEVTHQRNEWMNRLKMVYQN